ncbi:GNAT family N-acetyltransferase [uncultured Veillonella sp.]|uniref:GNAT family N-acetyltransferase n=1 Tax=uncultured Veillonella sp. TaxID=159268 RepID=UPI002618A8F7|nr:GNAT family N-acetyltransferase [uncultured Veillonella sp.]
MLQYKLIIQKDATYYAIKKLYRNSFPTLEQLPWSLLSYRSLTGHSYMVGFFDNQLLIGFVYLIPYKDILCIMFMAVFPEQQGKGYGSNILNQIKELWPHSRLCLYMEELVPTASNYEERLQRSTFYARNGYLPMNYTVSESGIVYDMLAANGTVTEPEYTNLMSAFLGPYVKRIYHNAWEPLFTALKFIP